MVCALVPRRDSSRDDQARRVPNIVPNTRGPRPPSRDGARACAEAPSQCFGATLAIASRQQLPATGNDGLHVSTFCWLDASYQEVQGRLGSVRDRKHLVEIPAPLTMQFSAEGLRLDSKRVS